MTVREFIGWANNIATQFPDAVDREVTLFAKLPGGGIRIPEHGLYVAVDTPFQKDIDVHSKR